MNFKHSLALVLFCFLAQQTAAQSDFTFGLLPAINLNKKLARDIRLNFKIESRQALKQGFFQDNNPLQYNYTLTDLSFLTAKKIGIHEHVAFGYLIRFKENEVIHRTIQQFIFSKKNNGLRLAHRVATDQTYSSSEETTFRLRYRIATEIPLNGDTVDPTEWYIKLNHEYLQSLQNGKYDLETRLIPFFGYMLSPKHKVEVGLDYRLNNFLSGTPSHRFWTSFNWYYSF